MISLASPLLAAALFAVLPDTIYVDQSNPNCPGTGTPEDPFCLVQAGIDAASDGDTIEVAPGVYRENIDLAGKSVDLVAPSEILPTIIDGGDADSVVRALNGETFSMDGFVIRNGQAEDGGGIRCAPCTATITNTTITRNEALTGGGIYLGRWGTMTMSGCRVVENSAPGGNGRGAGIRGYRGTLLIDHTEIVANEAGDNGGGIYASHVGMLLGNSTVSGNRSFDDNGGIRSVGNSLMVILNSTVAYNSQPDRYTNQNSAEAFVANSIFWPRSTDVNAVPAFYSDSSGTADVSFSIVDGGHVGQGNLDLAPRLTNPTLGDFRLSCDSPAIDAGTSLYPPEPQDVDGQPRLVDGDSDGHAVIDMGAHEFDFEWVYRVLPLHPVSFVGFEAHYPPAQAGNTAWVFISGGDGRATGGIPIPNSGGGRLMLDPDSIFQHWLVAPAVLREVPLTGCSNRTFFIGSPQPGFTGFYAGLSFDENLNVVSLTPTKRFELP